MKVIVAGGRDFKDYKVLSQYCDKILSRTDTSSIEIVSGGAKGADTLAERYAKEKGYPFRVFEAKWESYNSAAGPVRNREMAEYSDALIAFWNQKSPGTRSMISIAEELGLKVRVKTY
jgi:hypothetical protein